MPHITTQYEMYLVGGHHRQPRNANTQLDLANQSGSDVFVGSVAQPPYFPVLQYTLNNATGLAQLAFWSITDGTTGTTAPAGPLSYTVTGNNSLIITAWYLPITGPATGSGAGTTAIFDDAFSAAKGQFIDDNFVNVTSDASLTNDANVTGEVPTTVVETLAAAATVPSTGEPFGYWMAVDAGNAAGNTLQVPAGSDGVALAIYQKAATTTPIVYPGYPITGIVLGGIAVDGSGIFIIGGVPYPVDPWGPIIARLIASGVIVIEAGQLGGNFASQITALAAADAIAALQGAISAFEKKAQAKP